MAIVGIVAWSPLDYPRGSVTRSFSLLRNILVGAVLLWFSSPTRFPDHRTSLSGINCMAAGCLSGWDVAVADYYTLLLDFIIWVVLFFFCFYCLVWCC